MTGKEIGKFSSPIGVSLISMFCGQVTDYECKVFVPYRGLFNFNQAFKTVSKEIESAVFVPYRGLFNFNKLCREMPKAPDTGFRPLSGSL